MKPISTQLISKMFKMVNDYLSLTKYNYDLEPEHGILSHLKELIFKTRLHLKLPVLFPIFQKKIFKWVDKLFYV